ncbi:MAG TPA: patatin-like phospholipase family protein, partial [Burkholderiaceae bacterium]|nr:patatin-like phospholipase family protein [Burkholderiaceae bacterium]
MNLSRACIGCLIALATGCQTVKSHFNVALRPEPDQKLIAKNVRAVPTPAPGATAAALQPGESTRQSIAAAPAAPFRASFNVNGRRGNDKVLFFLALSGGGSRAAYLSATTMLRLQTLRPDVDLLNEVDVVSSVSGGSLAAAYYVGSRDDKLELTGPLAPLAQWAAAMPKLQLDAKLSSARCSGPLDAVEQEQIRALFNVADAAAQRVIDFCQQAQLQLPVWDEATVHKHMTRNYLVRWFIRWFRPDNLGFYWLTAWDRSDIMAQTFGNTLFASPAFLGGELQFRDLNPQRPFLIMNATNATEQASEDINIPSAERQREQQDNFAFGSVFTFTEEDFRDRLYSDLRAFPLARGVMASSAFPVVFPSMTLRDFRPTRAPACQGEDARNNDDCFRYLHVFDGGNSDNLGLRSIKRALLELKRSGQLGGYEKVIVLLVDAFTKPRGTSRTAADPRSTVSYLLDTNVVDAVDSLLLTNR